MPEKDERWVIIYIEGKKAIIEPALAYNHKEGFIIVKRWTKLVNEIVHTTHYKTIASRAYPSFALFFALCELIIKYLPVYKAMDFSLDEHKLYRLFLQLLTAEKLRKLVERLGEKITIREMDWLIFLALSRETFYKWFNKVKRVIQKETKEDFYFVLGGMTAGWQKAIRKKKKKKVTTSE